ncbi:MAG: glycosyltransferase family 2 protein [Kiritimatiellae bacterium]|nr:glycosyltransferase family 2 protein [Kiritimatiellia bacterium]
MGTDKKILSVIVPSYNMEAYLPKCLGSLSAEPEFADKFEVLVVNDGSKDRTSAIAHEFETKQPGVFRVIDKTNGNYGSCINAALPAARGTYVKILDADDWFETANFSDYLRFLEMEAAKGEGAADFVLNDFDFVYEDGRVFNTWRYDIPCGGAVPLGRFCTGYKWRTWMHAAAHKTANLLKTSYRQTEGVSYTDQEWIFYPFAAVRKMTYFPKVVYKYLIGREGQTCDPLIYLKSTPQQLGIVERMVKFYAENKNRLPEENAKYLRNSVLYRLGMIYSAYLIRGAKFLSNEELAEFDLNVVRQDEEIYNAVADFVAFGRFKYPYVSVWRKRNCKPPLFLRLLRMAYLFRVNCLLRVRPQMRGGK